MPDLCVVPPPPPSTMVKTPGLAGVGGRLLAQEVGLEGDHAGAGEEQSGVARGDEGGAGDGAVVVLLEEVAEGASNLVGLHTALSPGCVRVPA